MGKSRNKKKARKAEKAKSKLSQEVARMDNEGAAQGASFQGKDTSSPA